MCLILPMISNRQDALMDANHHFKNEKDTVVDELSRKLSSSDLTSPGHGDVSETDFSTLSTGKLTTMCVGSTLLLKTHCSEYIPNSITDNSWNSDQNFVVVSCVIGNSECGGVFLWSLR